MTSCVRWLLLAGVISFTPLFLNGQHIKGHVRSEYESELMRQVNVTVNSLPDSLVITFGRSDDNGYFDIPFVCSDTAEYYLKLTHVSTIDKFVFLNKRNQSQFLEIVLKPNIYILNSVEISAAKPITNQGDSTSYEVESFRNGTERNLEEVLKKLPNIRVETNGDVYFKNKRVEKILLDGDDLVGANYKLATRSIDPSVLSQVQALEHYNDNGLLQEIEQSDRTVLNLMVKEDKKSILFGNLDLGLGAKRNDALGNFFSYQKKIKVFSVLSSNNIGIQRMNAVNDQGISLSSKVLYGGQKPRSFTNVLIPFVNPLNSPLENINSEKIGALNFVYTPAKALKVSSNVTLSSDRRSQLRNQKYKSIVDSIQYIQYDTLSQCPDIIQVRLEAIYALSNNANLIYKTSFTRSVVDLMQNSFQVAQDDQIHVPQRFKYSLREWQQVIDLTYKLTTHTAFVSSFSFTDYQLKEELGTFLTPMLHEQVAKDTYSSDQPFDQTTNQRGQSMEGRVGILFGTANLKVEQNLGYNYTTYSAQLSQLQTTSNGWDNYELVRNIMFSRTAAKLKWNRIECAGNIQISLVNNNHDKNKQLLSLFQSNINLQYKASKKNQFSLLYSNSMTPAPNAYLVSSYVVNDYRSAKQGVSSFLMDSQYQWSLNYFHNNSQKRNMTLFANLFVNYWRSFWNFADYTQTTESTTARLINTPSMNVSGLNFTFEKLIFPLSGNIKTDINLSTSNSVQYVNGIQQKSRIFQPSVTFRYISVYDAAFNTEMGFNWSLSYLTVRQNTIDASRSFITTIPYLKLLYNKGNFQSSLTTENNRIQGNNAFLLKAKATYKLSEKVSMGIEGYNLLNQRAFNLTSLTPTIYTQSTIGLIHRTIILRILYTL